MSFTIRNKDTKKALTEECLTNIIKSVFTVTRETNNNYIFYEGNWYKVEQVDVVPVDDVFDSMTRKQNEGNKLFLDKNSLGEEK